MEEYSRQAAEQLLHAQGAAADALAMRQAAERAVVREQEALHQQLRQPTSATDHEQNLRDTAEQTQPPSGVYLQPEDVAESLRRTAAELQEQDDDLELLGEQIGVQPSVRKPRTEVLQGEVVTSHPRPGPAETLSTDTPDNAPTSKAPRRTDPPAAASPPKAKRSNQSNQPPATTPSPGRMYTPRSSPAQKRPKSKAELKRGYYRVAYWVWGCLLAVLWILVGVTKLIQ